jgi:hypothetical protein
MKNKIFEWASEIVIKFLANFNVNPSSIKFDSNSIENVTKWVIDQEQTNKAGWEKAEFVVSQFNTEFAERASWVVKTVVQLVFALAKFKNII